MSELVEERPLSTQPFDNLSTTEQLELLHEKLRHERTTVLKEFVVCALGQPDPSRVMVTAKSRYEKCKEALGFVEFLQSKFSGWEDAVKEE